MPGIDYRRLRAEVSMRQVLALLGFEPSSIRGTQLRGACPLPACPAVAGKTFSVDLERGLFRCFACGMAGNQLDLWAAFRQLPLHQAAQHLCQQSHLAIPWLPFKP